MHLVEIGARPQIGAVQFEVIIEKIIRLLELIAVRAAIQILNSVLDQTWFDRILVIVNHMHRLKFPPALAKTFALMLPNADDAPIIA